MAALDIKEKFLDKVNYVGSGMHGIIFCKEVANILGISWALGNNTKDPTVEDGQEAVFEITDLPVYSND